MISSEELGGWAATVIMTGQTDWRRANLGRVSSKDVNLPAQSKKCLHQPQHKHLDRVGAPQRAQSGGRRVEKEGNPGVMRDFDSNLSKRRWRCVCVGGRKNRKSAI